MIPSPQPIAPSTVLFVGSRRRERAVLFVVLFLSFVLPFLLTFIPFHTEDTTPYDGSHCANCDRYGGCSDNTLSPPTVCGADTEKRCCMIGDGNWNMDTARCGWTGNFCYSPLLGNFGLMLWIMLAGVSWVLAFCLNCLKGCCRDGRERERERLMSEQQQIPHIQLEYVRMT